MLTLRSTRFRGTFATLTIQECADRARVLIEMEDNGSTDGDHRRNIFIKSAQWRHLINLPYLHRTSAGKDHPPAGTFESTEFISHERTLRVVEMPGGNVVRIEMFREVGPDNDHEWLAIELTPAQWHHLVTLDYIVDGGDEPVKQPPHVLPSRYLLH